MSLEEKLADEFLNMNVTLSYTILDKCEMLCSMYKIEPEDFVDQWMAYAASHSEPIQPTIAALEKMERTELKRSNFTTPKTQRINQDNVDATPVPIEMEVDSAPSQIEDYVSHSIPSENFTNRSDSGVIVQTFGDSGPECFKTRYSGTLSVKIQNSAILKSRYMYEKFLVKQAALGTMSQWVIKDILDHYKLELTKERLKQYSGEMTICGRIASETGAKLDQNSVLLEGLPNIYRGQKIKLSTNKVDKLRLFSGQSVVVTGNNMKTWFTATKIYTGAPLPPSPEPENLPQTVQIMVAAGPFTLQDNLLYEPLEHLLKHALEYKPNVLILMGPFLDKDHPHLEFFNERYDSYFENKIDEIMQYLKHLDTQVVLVPSHRDIHNHIIFPSLPYKLKKRHANLTLAPNPFILDVEGLIISGSTADILFHLVKNQSAKGGFEDRMGQIVSDVFNQRSFYPLYPPESEIRVDYSLVEQHGMFEKAPHVMILPSNFKHFVKMIENCVVINPERLTKGNGAGTFAKIEVRATPVDKKVCERVTCVIQRI